MYNNIGNIESVNTYAYTPAGTEPSGTPTTIPFTYNTSKPDTLSHINNQTVGFNADGGLSYYKRSYTWKDGKLKRFFRGSTMVPMSVYEDGGYQYNAYGQRISKTYQYDPNTSISDDASYSYTKTYDYDHNGRLVREKIVQKHILEVTSTREIIYLYDESGMSGFTYSLNGASPISYYYRRNLLGDVIGIYNTSGTKVVEYAYDAWGNCTIVYSTNDTLANDNPIRYRGYYLDIENNFYYLNSRYYSPELRRFISPDDTAYLDPETPNGLHLYCYCNNDPVNHCDPSGCFSITAILIGAAIGFATSYLSDVIDNTKDGFEWSDFNTFEENWLKYIGSTLGGAIGGLGTGFASTLFCGGMGSVVEGLFTNDVSSIREAIISMAFGGLLSGIGYGFSKGIVKMFANRKITSILGNMSENIKVNKRLSQAGFGYLKIGKHGYKNIYEEIYDVWGYDTAQTIVSYGFDITIGLIF